MERIDQLLLDRILQDDGASHVQPRFLSNQPYKLEGQDRPKSSLQGISTYFLGVSLYGFEVSLFLVALYPFRFCQIPASPLIHSLLYSILLVLLILLFLLLFLLFSYCPNFLDEFHLSNRLKVSSLKNHRGHSTGPETILLHFHYALIM